MIEEYAIILVVWAVVVRYAVFVWTFEVDAIAPVVRTVVVRYAVVAWSLVREARIKVDTIISIVRADVVRNAVFGNVGSLVVFRVGASDAEFLNKEFYPLSVEDLCNLPKYHVCVKLMIDGVASSPFIAKTLPPFPAPEVYYIDEIIQNSRKKYSRKREEVEAEIAKEWLKEREFYPAYCWICQKEITVPFLPDPKKPVYCKECKEKVDKGEIKPPSSPPKSLIERGIVISLEELRKKEPEKPKVKAKAAPDLESIRKSLKESLKKIDNED